MARPPGHDTDDRDPGAPDPDAAAPAKSPADLPSGPAVELHGDLDDGGLSPEDVLLAAIRQSRRETLGSRGNGEADTQVPPAPESSARPEHGEVHLPMIDRAPVPTTAHADPAPRPQHPFSSAPPVLPQNDSGAGMGFEFSLAARPGRRRQ